MWLFLAGFVLHEFEEWNLVEWQIQNFDPDPGFTAHQARVLLILFALAGSCFAAPCILFLRERSAARVLVPLFVAPIFANSLTHISWLVLFGSYVPGVATSILLLAPVGGMLIWICYAEEYLPRVFVMLLLALTLFPPLGAGFAGRTLSQRQIEIQEKGGQFANRIWPAP